MARTVKKKKELIVEEKLAEALVPVEEQPYQVPENWCWTQGINIFSPMETQRPVGEKFKYIDIDSIDNKRQLVSTPKEMLVTDAPSRASRKLHQGDTVFSMVRPYLKNIAYIDGSIADSIASTGFYVCTPRLLLNPRYCYYLMVSPYVIDGLNAFMKGDNSPSIRKSDLENFVYPLPPLPEQQRIVDRIESLFSKLDEAKEKAQAVVDGFEDRKAAILHKAFTGELTKGWRRINRLSEKDWNNTSLEKVCSSIFDGDHMPPPKSEEGIPFLVISNVNNGHLSFENTRFVPQEYYDGLSETRKPEFGDVLYTLVGSYGIPVVVDDNRPFCFQRHMALLKPSKVNTYFLWYQLQEQDFYNRATEIATGTAQLTVPIKGLRKLSIKLPPKAEQSEIVDCLNELLSKEHRAKEAAEQVISQIDTMKKSILARAFRGELGTNDPADESAVELLKRIL